MSELIRIRRQFAKTEAELTRTIVKLIQPEGVTGIEKLTKDWGSILGKCHHEEEGDLIGSIYFCCSSLDKYTKAFHLILQFFYHYDHLSK